MFYRLDRKDHSKKVMLLKKLFGKLVWPVIHDYSYLTKTREKALNRKVVSGSREVMNYLLSLTKTWPAKRGAGTVDFGRVILDCVNHLHGELTYRSITEYVNAKHFLELRVELSIEEVRECLRKLTIFGPKSYSYCMDEFYR